MSFLEPPTAKYLHPVSEREKERQIDFQTCFQMKEKYVWSNNFRNFIFTCLARTRTPCSRLVSLVDINLLLLSRALEVYSKFSRDVCRSASGSVQNWIRIRTEWRIHLSWREKQKRRVYLGRMLLCYSEFHQMPLEELTEICCMSLLDIDTVFGAHMVPLGTCRFTPPNELSISSWKYFGIIQ